MQHTVLILEVTFLVLLSAIYSGLNISIVSLGIDDLRRKARLGNQKAVRVLPFREKIHFTLASILLANVAAVSATSLILEESTGGLVAGILTTLLIVVFGEVLPQAIFIRFALKFCAFFVPLLYVTKVITYPVAKLIQLLLDSLLKPGQKQLHSRRELGLLISEHEIADESELDDDEIEIIQGALQLSEKKVSDVMEPIEQVYWLADDTILDGPTVDEIKRHGYSRVPVFDKKLTRCEGVLLMKDMVDIDFDDNPIPVTEFPLHKTRVVGSRTALDTMFRKFAVIRSHLVPIEQKGKIIGIITAEDLIEEIIGHEIADETDHALHRS